MVVLDVIAEVGEGVAVVVLGVLDEVGLRVRLFGPVIRVVDRNGVRPTTKLYYFINVIFDTFRLFMRMFIKYLGMRWHIPIFVSNNISYITNHISMYSVDLHF